MSCVLIFIRKYEIMSVADFLYLYFGILTFCPKNVGEKCGRKMLMKLTPGRLSYSPVNAL